MFSFIIPFRAKCTAADWDQTSRLLAGTVNSMRMQSCGDWSIHIVGHEYPSVALPRDDRIHFHKASFPPPADMDVSNLLRDRRMKVVFGCIFAAHDHPRYIMPVDADDRVSSQLVEYLKTAPHNPAWIINRGVVLNTALMRYYASTNYNQVTSSSCILDVESSGIPKKFTMDALAECYWFLGGHHIFKEDMHERNIPVREIPFCGGAYLVGYGNNVSDIFRRDMIKSLKFNLRFYLKGKKICQDIEAQFGKV